MPIVHALDAVVARHPEALALEWQQCAWSYGNLQTAIASVRAFLAARGLAPGSRVALLLRNSPQYAALYYGILSAGCVVVPLNVHERGSVHARQVLSSGAALLIGDPNGPAWPGLIQALGDGAVPVFELPPSDGPDALAVLQKQIGEPDGASARTVTENELAAIIYTSGTTGRPKGVMLSHGNLYANAQAIIRYLALTDADRGLCVLPFQFSYGNSVLHTHLLAGARLIIEDNLAFPPVILGRLQRAAVTGFAGVPSTFALLLGRYRLEDYDLSHLRYVTQAGGPMPRAVLARLRERLPTARIFVMYGQTEATARLTYLPPERLDDKAGSVGIPIEGVTVDVRTAEGSAGPGVVGEICARGPSVMLGYWNDPAATAEVLHDGWLWTGDLGHRDDDGYLYIDGRSTEMIKVGAYRVSPQEVEEAIAAIEGVEEVGAAAIPDETLGHAVKAVVVLKPGVAVTPLAIKAHCRERLASYKVPKVVEIAPSLPKTATGKVQRSKLV